MADGDVLGSVPSPGPVPWGLTWDGTNLWNVDTNTDLVYKINPSDGSVLQSFAAPSGVCTGLTWDGTDLWISEAGEPDLITRLNPSDGSVLQSFDAPGTAVQDLAWDGTHLWNADNDTQLIYKINPSTGAVVSSIPAPTGVLRGLTWDGTHLWLVLNDTDRIYRLDPSDGSVLSSFASPGTTPLGLAWDGTNLWNANSGDDTIYKLKVGAFLLGAGAVSATGSLSASAFASRFGSGLVEGLGSISADGVATRFGAGLIEGVGSISASGTRITPVAPPGETLSWLGGQIDVRVEVDTGIGPEAGMLWDQGDWDDGVWGADDPSWFDISEYVQEVSISSGAERWGQRFQAGSATVVVDNTTGIYTPISDATKPWHLPFRPGRRLRVVAIPDPDNPVKVPLFTGYVDSSDDSYNEAGFNITTSINCSDYMAIWAAHNPVALGTGTGVQTTDARVNAALDRMSWDADLRDIQAGVHNVADSFLAQSTLEECQRAADAEGGAFFCSKDGKATFKARDWLTTDTRSTVVQGYLGYDLLTEGLQSAHVLEIQPSWEFARIFNDIQFARVGGTLQQVQDGTSQATYEAIKTYQRTDLRNNTDTEVLTLADRYLAAFKDDRPRVDSVTISGNEDPDNEDLNRLLWDSQFGDLLSILAETPHGWSFEKQVHVMAITHQITPNDWRVTFRLDDALTWQTS